MTAPAALAITAFSPADDTAGAGVTEGFTPVTEVTGPEIATAALMLLYLSTNIDGFSAITALVAIGEHSIANSPDPLVFSLKVQLYRFGSLLILVSVAVSTSTLQLPRLYAPSAVWNPSVTVAFSVSVTVALLFVEFVVTTVMS